MIALSVVKIYVKTLSIEVPPKSGFWGINGGRLTLETKLYARNIMTTKTRFVVHRASSHVVQTAL